MATKPVIMSIDDDPEVLAAIERDIRLRYRKDYRVMKASSGKEALDVVRNLNERGTPIALFLSDERMPEMTGTELLAEMRVVSPDSRRVLLTAYSDTEAAIRGINEVDLDYYLMKPWDPPEEQLYPLLDDLLGDWSARAKIPYDGIRLAGARWSASSYDIKDFLARNHVPYQWVDIEHDEAMRALVEDVSGDQSRLPVVFFPDGETLVAPDRTAVAEKVGLQTRAKLPFYDVVIVGGGPAGLAAAVYAGSEGLGALVVEAAAPGGQAGTSSAIENYLGFPSGISGSDLARRASIQAKRFGVEILSAAQVTQIRRDDPYRVLSLADGTEISTKVVILATGVSVRTMDTPGIEPLVGRGVYYGAAMTEAANYRGQDVCIVGGANSAGQGALFFSRYARKVTMLVRADTLEKAMSQYLISRITATANIEVMTGHSVEEVRGGDDGLKEVVVRDGSDEVRSLDMAAMFIFIGAAPRTDMVRDVITVDEKGFVITGLDLIEGDRRPDGWTVDRDPFLYETSTPGIFAVGDLRAGSGKRVAAAVGEGSACIGMVHRYLETV